MINVTQIPQRKRGMEQNITLFLDTLFSDILDYSPTEELCNLPLIHLTGTSHPQHTPCKRILLKKASTKYKVTQQIVNSGYKNQ